MKYGHVLCWMLMAICLHGQESNPRTFRLLERLYAEAQVGGNIRIHPELVIRGIYTWHLGAGVRLSKRHALGLTRAFFRTTSDQGYTTRNTFSDWGLRYAHTPGRGALQLYMGAGRLTRYESVPMHYCPGIDADMVDKAKSHNWYYQFGLRTRVVGPLYMGANLVLSGPIHIDTVRCSLLDGTPEFGAKLANVANMFTLDAALMLWHRHKE